MTQATLKIGIADGSLIIQIDERQIVMDIDQGVDLFNAVGEALEELGAFKDCDECPNKDECDAQCESEDMPCTLH